MTYMSDYRANYVPKHGQNKKQLNQEPFHYSNREPPMLLLPAIRDKVVAPSSNLYYLFWLN